MFETRALRGKVWYGRGRRNESILRILPFEASHVLRCKPPNTLHIPSACAAAVQGLVLKRVECR